MDRTTALALDRPDAWAAAGDGRDPWGRLTTQCGANVPPLPELPPGLTLRTVTSIHSPNGPFAASSAMGRACHQLGAAQQVFQCLLEARTAYLSWRSSVPVLEERASRLIPIQSMLLDVANK